MIFWNKKKKSTAPHSGRDSFSAKIIFFFCNVHPYLHTFVHKPYVRLFMVSHVHCNNTLFYSLQFRGGKQQKQSLSLVCDHSSRVNCTCFFLTYDNITEGSVQKNYLLRSNLQKKQKAQIPTNSHECSPTQTAVQLER